MTRLAIRTATPEEYDAIGELTARVYVDAGFMPHDAPYVSDLRDAATRGREPTCSSPSTARAPSPARSRT